MCESCYTFVKSLAWEMESTASARLVGGNQVSLPLTTTTHHRFAKVKRQGNFQPRNDVFAPQAYSLHANPHSVSPEVNGVHSGNSRPVDVKRELVMLSLPAIAGQAIDPLTLLMETAYIGRLGSVELGSAAVSMSIFNTISKLFNIPLLSVSTSFVAEDIAKVAAQDLAEEDMHGDRPSQGLAERKQLSSVSTALVLAIGIGIFEALALSLLSGPFLRLMGVQSTSEMFNPARQFLVLRALGAPAYVVSLALQGIFRGFKDTKTPVYCLGIGNLLAVFLFPLFIYQFKMGVAGAAISSVISQYTVTILMILLLNKRVILLPPKLGSLKFGDYLKSGGFVLGRTLSVLMTMTVATSMAARQGAFAMAAHQICMQVWLAVSMLTDALASSGQALIASSASKRDFEGVKEVTTFVLKIGVVTGIALAIVLGMSFSSIAGLFSKDPEVLQIVRKGVLFVAATQPITALAFIFDGLHYGMSDFPYAAWSMMVVGGISSAFMLYAPAGLGLSGVWVGLSMFMGFRMVAGFGRVLSPGENRLRRVSNGGKLPFSGFVFRRRRSSFRGVEALFSSASPAKLPGGRGSHSSASSDLAPRVPWVFLSLEVERSDRIKLVMFGHGIRFVTVRHVPIVAGKKRPFSGVSAYGGGDVCGFASRGRANRASGVWVRGGKKRLVPQLLVLSFVGREKMEDSSASFVGNRYWVLRHGKSIPNERGLIVSSMENGVLPEYQLAPDGVAQAQLAGQSFLKQLEESKISLDKVRICYSPFSRTTHTARVVAQVLNIPFDSPQCKMMETLRERYFGPTFELKSHDKYPEIWDLDEKDPFMGPEGGESADDVVSRLATAMLSMEAEFQRCAILVVSHGDPLQMLQNIMHSAKQHSGGDLGGLAERIQKSRVASVLSQHRKFALLTGELRPLL
ncbi:hypothetical protein YC2023_096221 [Brassica napus]